MGELVAKKKAATLKKGEMTRQKNEMNQVVSIDAEWMVGPWKIGTAKYAGFEGKCYVVPNLGEKAPIQSHRKPLVRKPNFCYQETAIGNSSGAEQFHAGDAKWRA